MKHNIVRPTATTAAEDSDRMQRRSHGVPTPDQSSQRSVISTSQRNACSRTCAFAIPWDFGPE